MLYKGNVFCAIDLKNFRFKTLLYCSSLVSCQKTCLGEIVGQGNFVSCNIISTFIFLAIKLSKNNCL